MTDASGECSETINRRWSHNPCVMSLYRICLSLLNPFIGHHSCLEQMYKFSYWLRDDNMRVKYDWKRWEAPPFTSFPGWGATQFLSTAMGLLDKLIFSWPFLPAPVMQRVLNDLVLSEGQKSGISADYYLHVLTLWWRVLVCTPVTE